MTQKSNCTLKLILSDLDINITHSGYSAKLDKLRRQQENPDGKITITHCRELLYEFYAEILREEELEKDISEKITQLARHIDSCYRIRREDKPTEFLKLSSIETELKKYLKKE